MAKCLATVLFLALMTCSVLAQKGDSAYYGKGTEVRAYATYLWPGADQPWTYAEGGEFQWARWMNSYVGAGLALGMQYWKADYSGDDVYVDPQSGFPVPMHHEVSGYAVAIPLGGSFLGRFPMGRFAINGELGARFIPIVSEVQYAVSMPNPLNPMEQTTLEQTVTIRPPIIALAAADVEYQLDSGISLFAGGGYQYDLMQPEIEIDLQGLGSRTESNEMKA